MRAGNAHGLHLHNAGFSEHARNRRGRCPALRSRSTNKCKLSAEIKEPTRLIQKSKENEDLQKFPPRGARGRRREQGHTCWESGPRPEYLFYKNLLIGNRFGRNVLVFKRF